MTDRFFIEKNGFIITTNPEKIDYNRLHYFLAFESYWAKNIPMDLLKKACLNSINFSVLEVSTNQFIGFARIVTDRAVFGYLADVFIDSNYRGKGLGKWLIETIKMYPGVESLRIFYLVTKDAHSLYSKFGWKPLDIPEMSMVIKKRPEDIYPPLNKDDYKLN